MESYASLSSDYGIGLIVAGVGLVTALPSLLVVPLAYIAFRELPGIVRYWPRLLTAAAVITGFFLLIVFVAGKRTLGKDASLGDVVLGGGAYWASALAAAALVYQQELFRPDDSDEAVAG